MLYSGWMAHYGAYGGALAVTEPETGKTELIENPLGPRAVNALALGDGVVYLGTSLSGNGLPDATGPVSLGLWSRKTRSIVKRIDFEGMGSVGPIAAFPGDVLVCLGGKQFRVYDERLRVEKARISLDGKPITCSRFFMDTDGNRVWFGRGKYLAYFNMGNNRVENVLKLDSKVGEVTRAADGHLYFTAGAKIMRLENPPE